MLSSGGCYWKFSTERQGVDFEPKTVEEQKEYWECEDYQTAKVLLYER